jgi:hypothetical protein
VAELINLLDPQQERTYERILAAHKSKPTPDQIRAEKTYEKPTVQPCSKHVPRNLKHCADCRKFYYHNRRKKAR